VSAVERVQDSFGRLAGLLQATGAAHAEAIARLAARYAETLKAGGTLWFAGNGGSAADAQHIATEYVVRYARSRKALAAVALTTDTSLLTACGNDFGFEEVFARQIEALVRPPALVILHSTSGESPNLLRAAQAAKAVGVPVVALIGRGGGPLRGLVDEALVVGSDDTGHIQAVHLAIEHVVCELVERELQL
jgi:D-sedoheptulose 7-phosphate isomerase